MASACISSLSAEQLPNSFGSALWGRKTFKMLWRRYKSHYKILGRGAGRFSEEVMVGALLSLQYIRYSESERCTGWDDRPGPCPLGETPCNEQLLCAKASEYLCDVVFSPCDYSCNVEEVTAAAFVLKAKELRGRLVSMFLLPLILSMPPLLKPQCYAAKRL